MRLTAPSFRTLCLALCILIVPGILVASSAAQSSFGSLVGNTADATGASIPKAQVMVKNNATSETRTTTTSDAGDYQVLSLPPGQYTVSVEAPGFKRYV